MSEARWLTDAEQRVWRDFSAAVDMLRAHLEAQLQRDAGMPVTYYQVLVALSEAPGRVLRMSDLALATRSSRSRLSHAVARMEDSGWIRREACPTDKRGAFAHLTDAGMAAIEAAAPGHVEAVRTSLFDPLTPEQVEQLGKISAAVLARLRPVCAAAAAEQEESEQAKAGQPARGERLAAGQE
ncbi:DNA-binding MarR family transcriptional regulator [Saccharomonospora amisosensis]|uniref:DNA-binding MarR family transcriptional regulator n=1 Tax=Saccharomonospora amisosensis TaxID=1128677 RepID=A0A7X5UPP2_9PSEU|nr:MarR family transcriptional regulator [Saccharomonospora amisosensis]NIJ11617.1 DNA-binding MarR family transcriptional regulator [Saccharomonospora amisosensis]